jgi:hypothetical protein
MSPISVMWASQKTCNEKTSVIFLNLFTVTTETLTRFRHLLNCRQGNRHCRPETLLRLIETQANELSHAWKAVDRESLPLEQGGAVIAQRIRQDCYQATADLFDRSELP